jgi:hypothetical protein
MGEDGAGAARERPHPDRRPHRAEPGAARGRGDLGQRKPIRETLAADLPLAIDQFRYFASAIRSQEGTLSEIDDTTVAYHFQEPLGVVGQIIPWNFPLLMAAWKVAPALAAGNCVVLKPAEQTPASILVLLDDALALPADEEPSRQLLPPGARVLLRTTTLPHRSSLHALHCL